MGKFFRKDPSVDRTGKKQHFNFKTHFNKFGGNLFGRMQNLSRAIVLPIAVLPVAGLLLGIGGAVSTALEKLNAQNIFWLVNIFKIMKASGQVVFSNLGVIFAIAIAFGFAKNSKGVAALSGFITFAVMTSVMAAIFAPYSSQNKLYAGFDPWHLTYIDGVKQSFNEDLIKNSGFFNSILGVVNTFDTSVLGGILVGWLTAVVHNRSYNIRMPRILAFFAGERFVPILAVFLGLGLGIVFFFLWPAFLTAFSAMGKAMGSVMKLNVPDDAATSLTGSSFHPTVGGAFIAMFFGTVERLLIPTGLHHVQYTPFWYTSIGGDWVDQAGKHVYGAYNIFFAQYESPLTGHMNQFAGTMFMSGRFAFMQYGLPFAALAMWRLAKPENRKVVGGILGSAALTSFLTGITEPILFSFLFVAPLCFVWHAILAGFSFMAAYCLNVVVGQGFAAGFIDFTFFGILPQILNKDTGFYWVFVIGLVLAPLYYFGFTFIIKKFNYKTLGREEGAVAANIALQTVTASLDKTTKKANNKIKNLITGLGGINNIIDVDAKDQILFVSVKEISQIGEGLIRLTGTKTIKKIANKLEIIYLDGAEPIYQDLEKELGNDSNSSLINNNKKTGEKERLENIFKGLGGRDNVTILDNCATRLRVTVIDPEKIDESLLKNTGAIAVVKKGKSLQLIYGLEVVNIKNDLLKIWK